MVECVNALKEWTGKASATKLYDSMVDEFTLDRIFFKIKGKPNIAIVAFTTDGDVFGGFYSFAVTEQRKNFYDQTIFAFSFESHGRCATPQRFNVMDERKKWVNVFFYENGSDGFVWFGVDFFGGFYLGNEKSNSYCFNMSSAFEGIENTTLTGQNNTDSENPPYHHCTRLVAVQLR